MHRSSYLPKTQFFAVALIVGIVLGATCHISLSLLTVLVGMTLACVVLASATVPPMVIGTTLFCIIGYASIQMQQNQFAYLTLQHIRKPFSGHAALVSIDKGSNKSYPYKLTFKSAHWFDSTQFWIFTKNEPSINPGDVVAIKNLNLKSVGHGSIERFMQREQIAGCAFVPHFTYQKVSVQPTRIEYFTRWFENLKHKLICRIEKKLSPQAHRLLALIFLGQQQGADAKELKHQCLQWGISHFLARSGLHVVLLFALLNMLLLYLPLTYRIRKIILLCICLLYASISWISLPFLRACIVIVCVSVAQVRNRQYSALHLINLAAIIMLLWSPVQLFFLDFQLSFGLTYVLIVMGYWSKRIDNASDKLYNASPSLKNISG